MATENAIAVRTATSLGSPSKGFFTFTSDPIHVERQRDLHLIEEGSLLAREPIESQSR